MNIDDMKLGDLKEIAAMFSGGSAATANTCHPARPVVVWTDRRGVIFGYCENVHARPITLKEARMCLYWSADVGGVFGLCDIGPTKGCNISAALPTAEFEGVTGVADVSAKAEKAWNAAPIQGRK